MGLHIQGAAQQPIRVSSRSSLLSNPVLSQEPFNSTQCHSDQPVESEGCMSPEEEQTFLLLRNSALAQTVVQTATLASDSSKALWDLNTQVRRAGSGAASVCSKGGSTYWENTGKSNKPVCSPQYSKQRNLTNSPPRPLCLA